MSQLTSTESLMQAILRCDHFVALNASRVEIVDSSIRPTSNVFQVRVQLEPGPSLFWIKMHSSNSLGNGELEYKFLTGANRAFADFEEFAVPNPVAYLPDFDAIVTEDMGGHPLNRVVKKSLNRLTARFSDFAEFERHFQRCGVWLARLHGHIIPSGEMLDPEILREYVDVRLAQLERGDLVDGAFRSRILTYLDSLVLDIDSEDLVRVWTHGDYAPYNVLVTPERVVVLDPDVGGYFAGLNNYCSRYEDIVHFYRFTRGMSQRSRLIDSKIREELAAAFLSSYWKASGSERLHEGSAAFRLFQLKYEVVEITGMTWPSLLGRILTQRFRLNRFRKWFDAAYGGMG